MIGNDRNLIVTDLYISNDQNSIITNWYISVIVGFRPLLSIANPISFDMGSSDRYHPVESDSHIEILSDIIPVSSDIHRYNKPCYILNITHFLHHEYTITLDENVRKYKVALTSTLSL